MTLTGQDHPFEDINPDWLPASLTAWLHDLTYDEIHSAGLGLTGLLAWTTLTEPQATAFTAAALAIAFGLKKLPDTYPVAGHVIRREPWYFTTTYIAAIIIARTGIL